MPAPHLFGKTHEALNRDRRAFSIRDHLKKQGVSSEEGIRFHLRFISETMSVNPRLDLTRYKVDPNNPNGGVYHG